MVKSLAAKASKKASEKRRLQRRKSEGLSFRGLPSIQGGGSGGSGKNPAKKYINRCLAAGQLDEAIKALWSCSQDPHPWVDSELCSKILLAMAMNCRQDTVGVVADYMRARNLRVQLHDYTTILQGASQLWPVGSAMVFVNAVEPLVTFPDPQAEAYFCRFSRLVLQEFLTDAGAAVERIRTQSATSLAAQRLALLDLKVQGHQSGGAISFVSAAGYDLYQSNKAVLWKGDSVLISPMASGAPRGSGERYGSEAPYYSAQQGWGPQPTSADEGAATNNGYTGSGGGYSGTSGGYGGRGDGFTPLEAEVMTLLPVLTVRLLSAGSEKVDVVGCMGSSGSSVRVDKLAPRMTTARQVRCVGRYLEWLQKTNHPNTFLLLPVRRTLGDR